MELQKIKGIIDEIFTNGYRINNILIHCSSPAKITVTQSEAGTYFKFEDNLPSAQIEKIIKLKIYVEGISFGQNSGIIKLKNFPDMHFDYEQNKAFGAMPRELDFGDIDKEIEQKFSGQARRKIAKKCLQYAESWATIASLNGVVFDSVDKYDKFVLKNQCYYFVEEQVKNDKELQYGTVISIFVLGLILPAIIKWAVDRVIRALLT